MGGAIAARAATGWHVVATPHPGVNYNYQIRELDSVVALGPSSVWAVGAYSTSATPQPYVLHWTGASWHTASLPHVAGGGDVRFLAASGASNLWAVGNAGSAPQTTLVFHFNGVSWHRVGASGMSSAFSVWSAATGGASNLWLGGYDISGSSNPIMEHWNGTRWTRIVLALPAGAAFGQVNGLSFVPGAATPTAVGYSGHGTVINPYAARFAGGVWHIQTAAATSGEFRSVVMISATNGWAVGTRYPNSHSYQTLIGHWNGTSWSTSSGTDRTGWNTLLGVSAGGAKNVWAAGYTQACQRCGYRTLAEHWNGSSWTIASTVNPSTKTDQFFADAVVPNSDQVWAVGTNGPPRPANGAEFFLAERDN
jgi:hypothetical protein